MEMVLEETSTSLMPSLNLKFPEFLLRLMAFPLCTVSLCLMVSANQLNVYGELKYNTLSGFEYVIIINAISVGYTLIAVPLLCLGCSAKNWVLFIADQIISYLMTTSVSASLETLYLEYEGDIDVSWSKACESYGKFCGRARASTFIHLMALVCFIILSGASAYRVFSKFEPPKEMREVTNVNISL